MHLKLEFRQISNAKIIIAKLKMSNSESITQF